ncbi:MAG: hypothetical protein Q8P22_07250, partial [Chloroflexota bacterium]|nr:hypothetical protein [Chloroflexota bacterium]
MRGWLWAGTGFAAFVSLLTILALLDAPRALEARPTSRSLASAVGGQSYTLGVENTSVSVQNAGLSAAKVVVDYYDPDGERVAQDTVQSLAAGASAVFDQADEAGLPHGFAGSAVVTADQAIRTIILKYIERGDELSVGADNGISNGFSRIYLPVIYSRFGLNGAWNTRFALQNVSTTATACVRMTYRQLDGTVAFTEPSPGAAPTPACPGGGLALPPQGTLLRNQADMSGQLPDQFEGSLIIELVTATGQPSVSGELLAATADIFNSERANFASYKGLGWNPSGTSDLSTTVLLPLIYKNFGEGNGWNTQYQISGADPDKATTVNVTYCCDSRLPGPGGSLKKTFSMQASASVSQALEDGLPDNFAGTAVITASQPIAVVDTMAWSFLDKASFGTFTAIPDSTASTSVWLPVVYKDFGFKGPLADADGWNSWFRVQVAHGGTANIQITYHGSGLPGGSVSFSDSVTASKTFSHHLDPLLPANFQGAATITSDQPIVVVAGITSDAYEGDTDAIFAGFGPDLFPGPPPSGTVSLVQGWNDACYTGPQQPIEGALTGISDKVLA